jgi:hypothetical protein
MPTTYPTLDIAKATSVKHTNGDPDFDPSNSDLTHVTKETNACCCLRRRDDVLVPSRATMIATRHSQTFAFLSQRPIVLQTAVARVVWSALWACVVATLLLVYAAYHHATLHNLLRTHISVQFWLVVVWLCFSIFAQLAFIDYWSVQGQLAFVLSALVIQSAMLTMLCTLFLHNVGIYGVVFFLYLLTAQTVRVFLPCNTHSACVDVCFVLCTAALFAAVFILPVQIADAHHNAYVYSHWVSLLQPPLPIWHAYTGAFLATLQVAWVMVVYSRLTHEKDASQAWFFIGRMYLVVVYGWQIVWVLLARRHQTRLCCKGSTRMLPFVV